MDWTPRRRYARAVDRDLDFLDGIDTRDMVVHVRRPGTRRAYCDVLLGLGESVEIPEDKVNCRACAARLGAEQDELLRFVTPDPPTIAARIRSRLGR